MEANSKYNGVKVYSYLKHSNQGMILYKYHNKDNVNDLTKSHI